ncbi:MAG: amino acid ABC transporter permease, partial [Silicimonas sp.]|nr:amino acid ABC transporter permease [Silicimonas sp.]
MADQSIQPPKETFRLSMLLYDQRYRSLTIQIIVLVLVLLGVFWLANNARINLAALGKPIRFDFLGDTASYDINQRLIEYKSTDSHGRATLVGLLNTLLVAFMGCVTATIIGVVGGVLRLS